MGVLNSSGACRGSPSRVIRAWVVEEGLLQLPLTSMVLVAAGLPRELAFLLVMLAQCVQVLEFKDNQLATAETKKGLSRRLLTAALPLLGRLDRVSAVQFLSVIEHT